MGPLARFLLLIPLIHINFAYGEAWNLEKEQVSLSVDVLTQAEKYYIGKTIKYGLSDKIELGIKLHDLKLPNFPRYTYNTLLMKQNLYNEKFVISLGHELSDDLSFYEPKLSAGFNFKKQFVDIETSYAMSPERRDARSKLLYGFNYKDNWKVLAGAAKNYYDFDYSYELGIINQTKYGFSIENKIITSRKKEVIISFNISYIFRISSLHQLK